MASYSFIILDSDIQLGWITNSDTYTYVADITDISPTEDNKFAVNLPQANSVNVTRPFLLNNVSSNSFILNSFAGTPILTVTAGKILQLYLYDISSPAGGWRIIPYFSGINNITTFTAASSDDSIVITNGTVSAPSGTIDFANPPAIAALNSTINDSTIATKLGFPAVISQDPFDWRLRILTSGNGIDIKNPDGVDDNTSIELKDNITLESLDIGDIKIDSTGLTSTEDPITINGVSIDTEGNITIPGDINITSIDTTEDPITINGVSIDVDGDISTSGNIESATLSTSGNITASGDITTAGTLSAKSIATTLTPITINGVTIDSEGDIKTTGSVTVVGNITTGATVVGDALKTDNATIASSGDISTSGKISADGDIATSGDLSVVNMVASGNAQITGDALISGTLTVTDVISDDSSSLTLNTVKINTSGNISTSGDITADTIKSSASSIAVNGVTIDSESNITTTGNLTAAKLTVGDTTVPLKGIATAICRFSDNNNGTSTNIVVSESNVNIASITGSQGSYTITFTNSYDNSDYGVVATLARGFDIQQPFNVFVYTQTATSMTIYTCDNQGNLLPATSGVTVVVFGQYY